ncbi:MAG: G8 domain-containing protein [Nonlabens sp.]
MKKIIFSGAFLLLVLVLTSFIIPEKETKHLGSRYDCAPTFFTTVSAVSTGLWNDASTWSNNQVPTSTDDVMIPAGIRVALSGSSVARTVSVDGTLSIQSLTTDFDLSTKGIMVNDGGLLQIGSENNPYSGNGLITLLGSDPTETLVAGMGAKLIGIMGGGRMEAHGTQKLNWTQLNATANAGTSVITLKETANWNVGDEIVIASTDFDPDQAEKRTITTINGLDVTLDSPLQFMHWGTIQNYSNNRRTFELDERAEVGLLTHNLKIQGDSSSENNGYGGHIMTMPNAVSKASNIELYRMGQKSQVGRYPWHWHLLGDTTGQFISNSSIHRSFNRLITVHGTNNTLVKDNVGYDFIGHGYFLENGSEVGNRFEGNLGVSCKRPVPGEETTPHDLGIGAERGAHPEAFPVTFWITNASNDFVGNVSAGSDGSGFWHVILDEILDGPDRSYVPGHQPMGIFDDNKAHSNLFSWGVDGGVDKVTGEIVNGHYRPRNPDGSQFVPVINRFDGYKSVDRNVWIRANTMDFYDCDFGDNGRANFFSYNQTLYNSLIVGKSANVGNPRSASEVQAGRSLPYSDRPLNAFANAFRGHSIYDGPSGLVDTHFAGFDQNGANAYCFQINGASRKSTNHFARGITYDPAITEDAKFDFDHISYFSYMYLSGLIDEDGSVTGTAGATVRPFLIENPSDSRIYEPGANIQMTDIVQKPEWGAWLTQNKNYNYFKDTDFTDKTDGAFTPRYLITEYPDQSTHAVFNTQTQQLYFDAPVITNDLDYTYYMQYHKLPRYMSGQMNGIVSNDQSVIIAYNNIPGIAYAGNASRVYSMAALRSSSIQTYFIKDHTVYIKHISDQLQSEFFQRQFGADYRYQSRDVFICNAGNCFDQNEWGQIVNRVTLIDYGVRSADLTSIDTNDDSRDNITTTDGLPVSTMNYSNLRVNFTVENNGNGIAGYTDYDIELTSRQIWEYFNTLTINYTGPDVEVIVENSNGTQFSVGTYNSSDINNVRIGQDNRMDIFSDVKKLKLRFHEEAMGALNTASSAAVQINNIALGADIPDTYSASSTLIDQDSDGDGLLDSEEIALCRSTVSASDFAIEFNGNDIFDDYQAAQLTNIMEDGAVFKATSTGGDPKLIKLDFLEMNGSDINTITVRMKANIAATRFQLFWANDNGNIGAARTIFTDYTGNGTWQELTLDLTNEAEWVGQTIRSLRLDPVNDNNVNFEIDWIRAQNAVNPDDPCTPLSNEDIDELSFKLYPNPVISGQQVYFTTSVGQQDPEISVYDVMGKLIAIEQERNSFILSNAAPGVYFVRFSSQERSVTEKLIVK